MSDSDLSGALCRACGQGGIALDTPARSDDQPGAEQLTPVMAAGPWSPWAHKPQHSCPPSTLSACHFLSASDALPAVSNASREPQELLPHAC